MSGGSTEEQLLRILKTCLTDLICDLGETPRLVATPLGEPTAGSIDGRPGIATVIEFGNDAIRGIVTLAAERRLFARLFPRLPGVHIERPDLTDWAREFANLAVGRFRNRVCARGIDVSLSCPRTLPAQTREASSSLGANLMPWVLAIADMRLHASLTVDRLGTLMPGEVDPTKETDPGAEQGSVLVF